MGQHNPLFDPVTPESRGERAQAWVFEMAAVVLAILALWRWVEPISRTHAIVAPLGVARYVDLRFMLDVRWASANALLASAAFLLGLCHRWRWGHLIGLFLLHVQYAARFSLGKTDHGSNFVGFALLSLGVAAVLFTDATLRRRAALGLSVLLFGAAYTSAAICKLIASGPRWVDGHHLWLWIAEKSLDTTSSYGVVHHNLVQRAILGNPGLGTAMLASGLVTELCGWLMWWRRPRPFIGLALVLMHVGIELSMTIWFAANQVLLLALALPIAGLVDRYHVGVEWSGSADSRVARPAVRVGRLFRRSKT